MPGTNDLGLRKRSMSPTNTSADEADEKEDVRLIPPADADKAGAPATTSVARSIGICVFYACCSVALSFINKTLLTVYAFPAYLFLLCCQLSELR